MKSRNSLPALSRSSGPEIISCFKFIISRNNIIRNRAEKSLRSLEVRHGFGVVLMKLIFSKNVPPECRLLGGIHMKNFVVRYWRSGKNYSLDAKEKEMIIKLVFPSLGSLCQENIKVKRRLLQFVCISIGEMVANSRNDLWGKYFSQAIKSIQGYGNNNENNVFEFEYAHVLLLYRMTKRLCSKQLRNDVQVFQNLSAVCFCVFVKLWDKYRKIINERVICNYDFVNKKMKMKKNISFSSFLTFRLCCKIMLILLRYGLRSFCIQKYDVSKQVPDFFKVLLKSLQEFLEFRIQCYKIGMKSNLVKEIEEITSRMFKIPQKVHTIRINNGNILKVSQFNNAFLPSFCKYAVKVISEVDHSSLLEKYSIVHRSILFLDRVVFDIKFEDNRNAGNTIKNTDIYKRLIEFFNTGVLSFICKTLIGKFFVRSKRDIVLWKENPEEYFLLTDLQNEQTLRHCAEGLYCTILASFEGYRKISLRYIKNLLDESFQSVNLSKLMKRNAAYTALGLGSMYLTKDIINFNQLYSQVLRKELLVTNHNYSLVKRRVIWAVGRWSEEHNDNTIKDFMKILFSLLNSEKDLVMILSVVSAFHQVLTGKNYDSNLFLPVIDGLMKKLIFLLVFVKREEVKIKIADTLGLLIRMVKPVTHIVKHMSDVIDALSKVFSWASKDYTKNSIQQSIISVTRYLIRVFRQFVQLIQGKMNSVNVQLIGNLKKKIEAFSACLIKYGTNPKNAVYLFAYEECIALWKNLLPLKLRLDKQMYALFPNLVNIIAPNFDNCLACLKIVESYTVIGKGEFLKIHSAGLNTIFSMILGNTREMCLQKCVQVLDILLIIAPDCVKLFASHFVTILKLMMGKAIKNQIVHCDCVILFARIVHSNQQNFMNFFNSNHKLIGRFINDWIKLHDWIYSSNNAVISAMGLLSFFPTNRNEYLGKFGEIMSLCVQTLRMLNPKTKARILPKFSQPEEDLFVFVDVDDDDDDSLLEDQVEKEKKKVLDSHKMKNLKSFILFKFDQIKKVQGISNFNALMQSVNGNILNQLKNVST